MKTISAFKVLCFSGVQANDMDQSHTEVPAVECERLGKTQQRRQEGTEGWGGHLFPTFDVSFHVDSKLVQPWGFCKSGSRMGKTALPFMGLSQATLGTR